LGNEIIAGNPHSQVFSSKVVVVNAPGATTST
jgi:hypothetical protein